MGGCVLKRGDKYGYSAFLLNIEEWMGESSGCLALLMGGISIDMFIPLLFFNVWIR